DERVSGGVSTDRGAGCGVCKTTFSSVAVLLSILKNKLPTETRARQPAATTHHFPFDFFFFSATESMASSLSQALSDVSIVRFWSCSRNCLSNLSGFIFFSF